MVRGGSPLSVEVSKWYLVGPNCQEKYLVAPTVSIGKVEVPGGSPLSLLVR